MKNSLDLIEQRMEEHLDIEEIAKAAYVSTFHFQRMFSMLTGITVGEYVRKRKLTLAAQELAMTSSKVSDVALKYGYETPESLAKAFRRIHGISPSEARNPGVSLKAFPRITFHLSLKGDKDMDYRIVKKGAFTVVGTNYDVLHQEGEEFHQTEKFWEESELDGTTAMLESMITDKSLLGICLEYEQDTENFQYMIAVESSPTVPVNGLSLRVIPASTWAIFTTTGPMPEAMKSVYQRVYQEWFPATGYEHAGGPELEAYPLGDTTAENYKGEIWIPIVKK
ncbi:AraC family transcriptional regulator [Paenibacillus amylolyticus]|nr:effector binding domain-containing protein [Paenibacillus amylolyticus]